MAGLGLMDNFANSSGLAALAMRELGDLGVDVWGGLIMEPPAGGVSADVARIALAYGYGPGSGARFLSLPTHHTRHVARQEHRSPAHVEACFHVPESGPLPDPLPEILDLAAAHDVVFNLGHVSDVEAVQLAEAAKARGVGASWPRPTMPRRRRSASSPRSARMSSSRSSSSATRPAWA